MIDGITKFIVAQLERKQAIPSNIDVKNYAFLDEGHIDSMGSLKFIIAIEEHYDIEFSQEDIASEQFRTVGTLAKLIETKLG